MSRAFMARVGETCSPCCPTSIKAACGRAVVPKPVVDINNSSRRARTVARVMTPARTSSPQLVVEQQQQQHPQHESQHSSNGSSRHQDAKQSPERLLAEVLSPVGADMEQMRLNLKNIVGQRHPMLMAAAEQIFSAGGKRLRPAIVFLVSYATCQLYGQMTITDRHKRLAEIMEMIHTASLVHDDVLDECNVRRGKETINSKYGTRVAVLAGDYLFAQSSWALANLENIEVIKLISQVIADFANGEISQATSLFNTQITLEQYKDKSFYKTASLIAASCRSAAVLSGASEEVKQAMFDYGKHLGLAFQVVDDILDFTQSTEQLGKPQGQDLASGNLTAPAIFALASTSDPEGAAQLLEIVESEFLEEGSLQKALELVNTTGGMAEAQRLAREEADTALRALAVLPEGAAKRSLQMMVDYVLYRLY